MRAVCIKVSWYPFFTNSVTLPVILIDPGTTISELQGNNDVDQRAPDAIDKGSNNCFVVVIIVQKEKVQLQIHTPTPTKDNWDYSQLNDLEALILIEKRKNTIEIKRKKSK